MIRQVRYRPNSGRQTSAFLSGRRFWASIMDSGILMEKKRRALLSLWVVVDLLVHHNRRWKKEHQLLIAN